MNLLEEAQGGNEEMSFNDRGTSTRPLTSHAPATDNANKNAQRKGDNEREYQDAGDEAAQVLISICEGKNRQEPQFSPRPCFCLE